MTDNYISTLIDCVTKAIENHFESSDRAVGTPKNVAKDAIAAMRNFRSEISVVDENSSATTAFQRLPDDLAKLLNYGAPLNAEMLNALAAAWNQKSLSPDNISDLSI